MYVDDVREKTQHIADLGYEIYHEGNGDIIDELYLELFDHLTALSRQIVESGYSEFKASNKHD